MNELNIGLVDSVALLKRAEFFSRLLNDDLYWLASSSSLYTFDEGEILFSPKERASRFYIVKTGKISIFRGKGAKEEEMACFLDGDVIGDFDFARDAIYNASARVQEKSEILVFPGKNKSFQGIATERPDVASRILLRSVAMISSRIRSTQQLISRNIPWVKELKRQMYTDQASGLWTRTYLDEEIFPSLKTHTAFIFIKPDRFKTLCDRWGHGAGDMAMERIANVLKATTKARGNAWAIRLKSNETLVVATNCRRKEAQGIASALLEGISRIKMDDLCGKDAFPLTASLAMLLFPVDEQKPAKLIEAGYEIMLKAWQDGGNRIYTHGRRG